MVAEQLAGMVLRIERSSIHDGDGMRTVVFLKGCPLQCEWCSTPESQNFHQETTQDGKTTYGKKMTVGEVMTEVRKDSPFYFMTGGGMTISGGELLAQPCFARELLHNCTDEGINTAVETSLFGPWNALQSLLPYINTVYADLKAVTPALHKEHCGITNEIILDNFRAMDKDPNPFRLIIRTPLIPGINDTEAELAKIGEFCASLKRLVHLQLLPYHRLGESTYQKLGRDYKLAGVPSPTPEHMEWCQEVLKQYLDNVVL